MAERLGHWVMEAARFAAILFFLFCLYEGLFKHGGSNVIFMGVLALSTTLLVGYVVERVAFRPGT